MIWLNGALLERGALDASGAGTLLGWGVFTTLGVRDGRALFAQRHLARLRRDAHETGLACPFSDAQIADGWRAVLRAQAIGDGWLRLTLTQRGDGRWNDAAGADLSIVATPGVSTPAPARVQLSPFRVEARRPLAGVKTTSYLPYLWAWRQAHARGCDEALLRESRDWLCEGARSTLFWERDGTLHTPDLNTGCLRGVGRDLVLEWANARQIEVRQGFFAPDEARAARALWTVSAANGPRAALSWHDEDGALQREYPPANALCCDLQSWWRQSEGAE